jgi:hypothetical protein
MTTATQTTATTVAAPAPGTPEYDAAMVAKAGLTPAPAAPAEGTVKIGEQTPAPAENLLAGKFKDAAALEAAYKELEKKLGTPPPPADPALTPKIEPATEAQDVVQRAGLKQEDLAMEYAKDGKLSDASYTKLAAVGVTKPMVDAYLNSAQAEVTAFNGKVYAMAGGEAEFTALAKWAANNVPKSTLEAYNAAIDSGNLGQIQLAVSAFKGAYQNANPTLLGGAQSTAAVGFRSAAEQNAAIQDPRYKKDEAYREDVYKRIGASTF